jgi:hypothetical protein
MNMNMNMLLFDLRSLLGSSRDYKVIRTISDRLNRSPVTCLWHQPNHDRILSSNMQQDYSYRGNDDDDHVTQPPLHMHRLPKGHGPAVASPTFVLAQGQYDDLGRSVEDGFNVSVGRGKKERIAQPGAFDFWKDLELGDKTPLGSSGSVTPSGSSSTPIKPLPRDRQRSTASGSTKIVVPRSEWFIRKALLAKAEKEKQIALDQEKERMIIELDPTTVEPSTSATPQLPSAPATKPIPPPTSSLASLLSLPPPGQTAYEPPTHFHIKPNNKGYQLLEKGGWSGVGGLGRPEGWKEVQKVKQEDSIGVVKREEGEVGRGASSSSDSIVRAGKKREEPIDVDAIIDLTEGDEDEEDDDDQQDPCRAIPSRFGEQQLVTADILSKTALPPMIGPGRVAPVATYLKHDLSGIGHIPHRSYSSLRPAPVGGAPERKKKVTHTLADIKAVQRGKVVQCLSEESMEMRRRGKAKRDAKRDKEDRRKWQQIIAA